MIVVTSFYFYLELLYKNNLTAAKMKKAFFDVHSKTAFHYVFRFLKLKQVFKLSVIVNSNWMNLKIALKKLQVVIYLKINIEYALFAVKSERICFKRQLSIRIILNFIKLFFGKVKDELGWYCVFQLIVHFFSFEITTITSS